MKLFKAIIGLCSIVSIIFIICCYCCISNEETNSIQTDQKSKITKKSLINDAIENYNLKYNKIQEILTVNPNDLIYRYVNLPLDMKYGSNAIPLTVAALLTNGSILELGMGMFSTPLLHKIAADKNRQIVSIDTDFDWMYKFIIYNKTSNHKLYQLTSYELDLYGLDQKWGLVLVDHIYNKKRSLNVVNFSKLAQIVVVHDAEKSQEDFYSYEKKRIRSNFKYACKFSIFSERTQKSYISTLILSNYIDLNKLKTIFNKVNTDFGHVACDLQY